jgi:stage II sporulation protein D
MKKITLTLFILFTVLSFCYAQPEELNVRLFSEKPIKKLNISCLLGNYSITANDKKINTLEKDAVITFQIEGKKIKLTRKNETLGTFNEVSIEGLGFKNIFKISPTEPQILERIYDDDLIISVEKGYLRIINKVSIENYVAGVVQSEILGSSNKLEFFKIQAIITRTYAINNMMKHYKEGFNLCDDVHCQVYRTRCNNPQILMAANTTAGLVIVDKDKKMISAAFHSNSGGETVKSEDVWSLPTSYLKSVQDTFSLAMKKAYWIEKMPVSKWLNYLESTYNIDINNEKIRNAACNFTQDTRKIYFLNNILLKNIRKDLNLRSTFFSVSKEGDQIILKGRGFGHGVGLSQEGAIRMVDLGYTHEQIINFYYKDTQMIDYLELKNQSDIQNDPVSEP